MSSRKVLTNSILSSGKRKLLIDALEANVPVPPLRVAALASYRALSALPDPRTLLDRVWPKPVDKLLTQQIHEVDDERHARATIPCLTAIEGEVENAVRLEYEENPYPRWVVAPSQPATTQRSTSISSGRFPLSSFRPLGDRGAVDILIAGCGTGEHSIGRCRYRL